MYMDVTPFIAPPTNGYVYYPSTAYYGVYGNTNYGFPTPQPFLGTASPAMMQPLDGMGGMLGNGSATYTQFPSIANTPPIIPPSTPKQVENSFSYQTEGDLQLQQLNYMAASERYRKSIDAARDRADPRYRMAVTLAARSRFLEAVDQLKLAVQLDPVWPQNADNLDILFGAQNTFEKQRVKQRVAEWTLQDARDPRRLFLLGAMLYMDNDPNAKTMIETAILLDGQQDYLTAFLAPRIGGELGDQGGGTLQQPSAPVPNPPKANFPAGVVPPPAPGGLPPSALPTPLKKIDEKPIPALPPLPGTEVDSSTNAVKPGVNPLTDDMAGPTLPPLP